MSKSEHSRVTFEAALQAITDQAVHEIPAWDLLAAGRFYRTDGRLRDTGATDTLLARMGDIQSGVWQRSSTTMFSADLIHTTHSPWEQNQHIGLLAVRFTRAGKIDEDGLVTVVGARVNGNEHDIVPIGDNKDLAFAANSIIAQRSRMQSQNGSHPAPIHLLQLRHA